MKEVFSPGLKLFGRRVICTLMSFFLCISMLVICKAAFSHKIGYTAFGTKGDSKESVKLYTYYYDDGKDLQKENFEKQGYQLAFSTEYSPLGKTGDIVFGVLTQSFCTMLLLGFLYPILWDLGTADSNACKFKHKEYDRLRGLKIGLVSSIPAFLLWLVFVTAKSWNPDFPVVLYRFLNCSNYIFIDLIAGGATSVKSFSVGQFGLLFLLLLLVPAASWGAYWLGYHNISIGEKLIYKKKQEK